MPNDKPGTPHRVLTEDEITMIKTLIAEKIAMLGGPEDNMKLRPRDIIELTALIRKVLG